MKCDNAYCLWNAFEQCCPESEETYDNAIPNTLDCPSSLRKDFQEQMNHMTEEIKRLLNRRNFKELNQILNFVKLQRETDHINAARLAIASWPQWKQDFFNKMMKPHK